MASSGGSSSSQLQTHLPPGTEPNGFNITVVAYVSDNLGATAVTSMDVDGAPLALVSAVPDQVRYHCWHSQENPFRRIKPAQINRSLWFDQRLV